MRWDNENIENMVKYINTELAKGRRMIDIGISDFQVDSRSIDRRLSKEGYIMINNELVSETKMELDAALEKSKLENEPADTENKNDDIKIPEGLDIDRLIELQELIEPIKELLEKQKDLEDDSELPGVRYTDIKQKTFKVDREILAKWEAFCKVKKGYKMQDLTSRALAEYMQKHEW